MQATIHNLTALAFFAMSIVGHASTTNYPSSMSAIGDSTSTATLAQYKRSQAMNPFKHPSILYDFLRLAFTRNKQSLSDWKYSWSTGLGSRKVFSHAGRLKKLNPHLAITNFAEPGARIDVVLSRQLPNLKKWSKESYGKNYPDYITLMVGANDICADTLEQSTSVKSYSATYKKILVEILSTSKNSRILVSALPPYQDLLKSESAFYVTFPGLHKCGGFWKIAPLCKSITESSDPAKLARRIRDMNSSIYSLVHSLRKTYGDRVRVAHKVADRRINKEDLSIDCFHPNADAQGDLAELTWSSTWWANQKNL